MNDIDYADLPNSDIPNQVPGFKLEKTVCCYFLREEETKSIIKLNDSSVLIWRICTGEWSVGEMIEVLKESYPDAAENMENDVYRTLGLLKNEGVINIQAES